MNCKRCKKECMEDELVDGFCLECREKYKGNTYLMNNIPNSVSKIIRYLSFILIFIGIISGIICSSKENFVIGIAIIVSSIISSIFIYAFAEIIQLLEDIKNK